MRFMAVAIPTAVASPAEDGLSLGGVSARKALLLAVTAVLLVVSTVLLAPAFADLPEAWVRIQHGDARWLTLALAFEVLSFLGHIVLFSAVAKDGGAGSRIGLWASTQINLAGHAAPRLLASPGAGGAGPPAGGLRRAGRARRGAAPRNAPLLALLPRGHPGGVGGGR